MSNAPEILILTSQPDKAANLTFLLQLSNYHSIHISDGSEAFNYLVQRQHGPQPVNLLLIAGASEQQQFLKMLDDLERCGAMLPILLIHGDRPVQLELLDCKEQLKSQIKQCQANMTHACINEIINSNPHL
jgi:hypothetical protein